MKALVGLVLVAFVILSGCVGGTTNVISSDSILPTLSELGDGYSYNIEPMKEEYTDRTYYQYDNAIYAESGDRYLVMIYSCTDSASATTLMDARMESGAWMDWGDSHLDVGEVAYERMPIQETRKLTFKSGKYVAQVESFYASKTEDAAKLATFDHVVEVVASKLK